jgi:polyhydroxybutyrate depolymerase
MRTTTIIACAALLLTTASSFAQWQNKGFTHQGNARQYRVYKSPSYNASAPASLVLTLHGLGDDMTNFSSIGMNMVADTANIIVVVPQAMNDAIAGTAWNSGAGYSGYYPNAAIDDVAFMSALIDTIKANYAINPNRIYACGFSMGGFMTERLAIALNNKITAFASVSGTFGFGLPSYNPGKSVSIAHFHGTADGTVPYAGNTSGISADSLVKFWVNNNHCNTSPQHTSLPNTQNDGYTVDHDVYSGGQNNTEVEFFKVTGAAHVWLTAANDISYTVEIWKFFNKHRSLATGLKEEATTSGFSIFPNPASDQLTLRMNDDATANYAYSISDLSGKEVLKGQAGFEKGLSTISLNLNSGLYFITLKHDHSMIVQKIAIR